MKINIFRRKKTFTNFAKKYGKEIVISAASFTAGVAIGQIRKSPSKENDNNK